MSQSTAKLNLDEALVSVNRSSTDLSPLDVYYQLDECYGCPMEKFKTLHLAQEEFVMRTKYDLHLELRDSNGGSICKFDKVTLNNQGLYQINVFKRPAMAAAAASELMKSLNSSSSEKELESVPIIYECNFQILDDGQCLWCPFAMLLFFLILITFAESLYHSNLFSAGSRNGRRKSEQPEADTLTNQPTNSQEAESPSNELDCETANGEPEVQIQTKEEEQPPKIRTRIESLDAFRGLTIAGMIMVNYGGAGLTQLEHKAWDGLTCADLVFPFFIFSMGASVAISTRRLFVRNSSKCDIYRKIIRRSFILMCLGLCLNSVWLRGKSLNFLRLTGVLQRFSISYLYVASVYTFELFTLRWIKSKSFYRSHLAASSVAIAIELGAAFSQLTVYLYFTFYYEYSDNCPAGYLGPGGQTANGAYADCTGGAAAWLDHYLLSERHLYHDHEVSELFKTSVSHDPEGLLGFTTSILLTLIGLQCGKSLVRFKEHKHRLLMFSQWIILLALASISVLVIPINKRLWSLTFVTVTGCFAFLIITVLYLLMDVRKCKRTFLLKLLVSAGKNSIFLYVGHSLLSGMLPWWFKVPNEASHIQLLARLTWSTFVWLLLAHYMALKKLFIRI